MYNVSKFIQITTGLKGHQIGGAMISEKHANFIINVGGAKAADVRALIDLVKKTIREKFGVEMKPEVQFIGDWT